MLRRIKFSARLAYAALACAMGFSALPASNADHLPPGVRVIFVHPPAYVGKYPDAQTTYSDADIAQAEELAKLGDADVQVNLGVMLQSRGRFAEAAQWYKRAASLGVATAAYDMGTLYYNGQGVPQDDAEALRWFRLGAERGDAYGEFQLGMMYGLGRGVAADPAAEFGWYAKAARQGLPAAQYNLAVMYHNGEGTAADDAQAYAWLLVAEQGGVDVGEAKPVIREALSADAARVAEQDAHALYVASGMATRRAY